MMASSSVRKGPHTSISCDFEDDRQILETPSFVSKTNIDWSHVRSEPTKKAKALTSNVWNFFAKIGMSEDNKEKCKCKACGKEYTCASKSGTSHLARHIPKCRMTPQFHDVGRMLIDYEGKSRRRKFDMKMNREIISELIITHDLPFNIVEWGAFRNYQKFLNEDCGSISTKMAKYDVMKRYETEKEVLKQQLSRIPSRVCLTFDSWIACPDIGYISLTAHYVDEDWKLKSKILSFAHMQPPHTGRDMSLKVLGFLKDWGIERKIFSITLDSTSSNDNMQNILREHLCLSNSLLLNGDFFHIRCSAHILNHIVQDGLKVADDALQKIRQSVHYIRASESRRKQFFQCVEQVGGIDTSIALRFDCVTRWKSTYAMLEAAINYRRAFHSLRLMDKNYKWCPSNDEWDRAISICGFLKPFYTMTNLTYASSYPTSNLYFGEIWRIERLLTTNLANDDFLIQSMCCKMKENFDKYWSEYSLVLAFGAILDPTKKFNFLRYTYSRLDPNTFEEKIERVKKSLYALFEEYRNKGASTNLTSFSSNVGQPLSIVGKRKMLPTYDDFEEFDCQEINSHGKSQLDLYLEEPRISFLGNFDVLSYWKGRSNRFGDLAKMACDVLSIPITTVASDSAFSIGSRVLSKYKRSSMFDEAAQALVCTRNWLLGFVDDDDPTDVDDDPMNIGNAYLSNADSNAIEENVSDDED